MHTRRSFLAAAGVTMAPPARPTLVIGPTARLRRMGSLQLPSGRVFSCPGAGARLLAVMTLQGLALAVLQFTIVAEHGRLELLALIGPDATLLALEPGQFMGHAGDSLGTRAAMLADRRHVSFARSAAWHGGGGWQREEWTDYRRLEDGRMIDTPARPVLAGTCQQRVEEKRAMLAARVAPGSPALPPDLDVTCRDFRL